MELSTYLQPTAFLQKAESWLEQREVENNLILGVCKRMARFPEQVKARPFLAVVEADGEILLSAMITPPHNLVLAGEPHEGALRRLAQHLKAENWDPPGVLGSKATGRAFATIWAEFSGKSVETGTLLRLFALTEVRPPPGALGGLREAAAGDLPLAAQWVVNFQEEALRTQIDREEAREMAEQRIALGDIFLWEAGEPVSMAAKGRPTGNVITIGLVYTPPEHRRKGYAGACVAALSQRLLDAGYPIVSLFTDLANPTPNHIYTEIGYKPVCDFDEYKFNQVDSTIQYYDANARSFYQRTAGLDVAHLYSPFLERLPSGAHILDAGCGSGRDSLFFINKGYRVTAMDASKNLAELASRLLNQPVRVLRFDELDYEEEFDGVWANASLLHVPRKEMPGVLERFTRALKPGGIFYLSFKHGSGESLRDDRRFNDYDEPAFRRLLSGHPQLDVVNIWTTRDNRPECSESWLNVLVRKN